ncbi:MAG: thiosulfate oxidation carrier complex protein SoxZ [Alphaproteobacteria bacterium]
MAKPRVKVPKSASAGDVITIKTLMKHKMETGLRKNKKGEIIPQDIIHTFEAKFNGAPVFSVNLDAGISANPYFSFPFKVKEAGEFEFTWQDDSGETFSSNKKLKLA